MQPLNIERINNVAPYTVWVKNSFFFFDTDFGVKLRVNFVEDEDSLSTISYWLNIVNLNDKVSPHDAKVMPTIWTIIEEFFIANPEVLLYICDSSNEMQAMRSRLFRRWFNLYHGRQRFIFCQAEIPEESTINYVSMILPKVHPLAETIVSEFDEQVAMFKNHKPKD